MKKAQLISRRGDQSGTGNKFAVFYIRKPEQPLLKFAWLYKKERERNREHRIRETFQWNRGWVIAKVAGGAMWVGILHCHNWKSHECEDAPYSV